MNDGVDALQCSSQVLRARKITDHRARALRHHLGGPAQQDANVVTASWQFLQQESSDEARCASQCDQAHGHVSILGLRGGHPNRRTNQNRIRIAAALPSLVQSVARIEKIMGEDDHVDSPSLTKCGRG